MELWFAIFVSVTVLVTLTKYMSNQRKDSQKSTLMNDFGPALALGILFATLTSLVVFLF